MIDAIRQAYYLLPSGLQRAVLVRRREPVWLRAGILFVHIPKAAGTSINEALYGRFMGHVRASDVLAWGSSRVRALPSFAVTRNPWDRLVSAYRFARRGGGTGGLVQAGMNRPERYRVPEFETFERFVTQWLASRDIETLDGVFQPQSLYVCDPTGRVLVDHVGRIEDLEPTRNFIRQAIGEAPEFGRSNRSGDRVDYRQFYTPALADLVGDIYRRDVQQFDYRF